MDDMRAKLGALAGHASVAAEVDARIAKQATARIDAITARLDELRPLVLSDPGAEDEYLRLVEEQGRLKQTLARVAK